LPGWSHLSAWRHIFAAIKAITHAQKGKVHPAPSRDEVFIYYYGNFSSQLGGMKCLYGNFSSRLGGIPASVAEIPSRRDKWQDQINTLWNLYYEQDLGKHPVPPGRDHINRPWDKTRYLHIPAILIMQCWEVIKTANFWVGAEEVGQQAAKHHGYWAPNSTRGFIDCWLSRSEHLSD
jgi:hypothetical protein